MSRPDLRDEGIGQVVDGSEGGGGIGASAKVVESYFDGLGTAVEQAWAGYRNSHERFPEVAARVLTEMPIPQGADAIGLLEHLISRRRLLPQEDLGFGQPPITLYRARDFYISALFWLDGTTTIHQHAFSGAFRVLVGSSIHANYGFSSHEMVTRNLLLGDLRFEGAELLRQDDVRQIAAGGDFIHALFHLDRPSVTIVIRTNTEYVGMPQLEYLQPGLAFNPYFQDETLGRQLAGLATLHEVAPDHALRCAREMIAGSDLFASFLVVKHWAKLNRGDELRGLIGHVVTCHGSLAELLHPVFDEKNRQFNIAVRRRLVHDPGHRLFLALLLNLPTRSAVNSLLRQRYPDQEPGEVLGQWVEELSSPKLRGVSGLVLDDEGRRSVRAALHADAGDTNVQGALGTLASSVTTTPLLEMLLA